MLKTMALALVTLISSPTVPAKLSIFSSSLCANFIKTLNYHDLRDFFIWKPPPSPFSDGKTKTKSATVKECCFSVGYNEGRRGVSIGREHSQPSCAIHGHVIF